MNVYKLQKILDDPRYEGFATFEPSFYGKIDVTEDFLPDSFGPGWEVPRLSQVWRPLPVEGRVRLFNDFPCLNLAVPVFSPRAVAALRDLLEPNGELLPVTSTLGTYFAYNTTTLTDALNADASDITYFDDGRPMTIERYEFKSDVVATLSIFQIVEMPGDVYVTDRFVERVRERSLNGFDFVRLWPLKPGEDWEKLHAKSTRRREKSLLPKGRRIKGESIAIVLPLKGKQLSPAEGRRIDQLMERIDLTLAGHDDPTRAAVGVLEMIVRPGMDLGDWPTLEPRDGEVRLLLSCPEAQTLVDTLRPLLKKFEWSGVVKLIKRSGEFIDKKAREVVVPVNE